MSRKRKNAGEGYGYMFHGSFTEKADAQKKERQRKGSFIRSAMTKQGLRYLVMTPRTNPPKRRRTNPKPSVFFDRGIGKYTATIYSEKFGNIYASGFTKKEAAKNLRDRMRQYRKGEIDAHSGYGQNPSELVVLGANPHERTINLPPNSTITIRTNPAQVNPGTVCGAMIGGYECTRKPGHRGPHLPQGATMRTRSRLRKRWQPNPSAEALREDFTGRPAEFFTVYDEPHVPSGSYAQLGELLVLYVKPELGRQVQVHEIRFGKNRPLIVSAESARQLYFVGGDQDITPSVHLFSDDGGEAGLIELGEVRRIDYKQRKEHVPDPSLDEWRHDFGEETGVRPILLFDRIQKRLILEGGAYTVRREGIVN